MTRVYNQFKKKWVRFDSNVGTLGRTLCCKCDALLFDGEGRVCCADGKVKLRPLHPATAEIEKQFSGNGRDSKEFLNHIRSYNSRFVFD